MSAQELDITKWDTAKDGPLTDANMIKKLESLGFSGSDRRVYSPGRSFPDHTHEVTKIGGITSGKFQMGMYGQSIVMEPGDTLLVPKQIVHWAKVVGDEDVSFIDAEKA